MKINSSIQTQAGYQGGKLKKAETEAGGQDRVEFGSQPLEVTPDVKNLKSGVFGLGSGDGCKDIMIMGELAIGTALGAGLGVMSSCLGLGARVIGGPIAGLATSAIVGGVFGYLDKSVTSGISLGVSAALGSQFGGLGVLGGAAAGGIGIGLVKKGIIKEGIG